MSRSLLPPRNVFETSGRHGAGPSLDAAPFPDDAMMDTIGPAPSQRDAETPQAERPQPRDHDQFVGWHQHDSRQLQDQQCTAELPEGRERNFLNDNFLLVASEQRQLWLRAIGDHHFVSSQPGRQFPALTEQNQSPVAIEVTGPALVAVGDFSAPLEVWR